MNLSPELLGALMTPTVIVSIIGWLLKRAIATLDHTTAATGAEVKALAAQLAARDVTLARLEERMEAVEREVFSNPK